MKTEVRPLREGDIKIVFDVHDDNLGEVIRLVAAGGFSVQLYPAPDLSFDGLGGAEDGFTRVTAARVRRFTRNESAKVLAAFEKVATRFPLGVSIVGVDAWSAT